MIEFLLSPMSYVVIEHVTKCHDWISLFGLINLIPLLNWISSVLWFDLISTMLWFDLNQSCFLVTWLLLPPPPPPPRKVSKYAHNHIVENMIV